MSHRILEHAGEVHRDVEAFGQALSAKGVVWQEEDRQIAQEIHDEQIKYQAREKTNVLRTWTAGLGMLFVANLIPFINDYPDLHYLGSLILVIGGSLLTLISDRRCTPKAEKVIARFTKTQENATLSIVVFAVFGYFINLWWHW